MLFRTSLFVLMIFISSITLAQITTYIHCGGLIDGDKSKVQEEQTIIVTDGVITSVEKDYIAPAEGAAYIDLKDKIVMPGFIDAHVHIEADGKHHSIKERMNPDHGKIAKTSAENAKLTLMAGFTTVRDLGGIGVNVVIRDSINNGKIPGPRILSAHKMISATGGHGDPTNGWPHHKMGDPGPVNGVANGPTECRKAVRQQKKFGADCIKVAATGGVLSDNDDGTYPAFTELELATLVNAAKDLGLKISAHAHGTEGIMRAVKAGVNSIEHGTYIDKETMDLMKEFNIYLVPTISAGKAVEANAKIEGFYPDNIKAKAEIVGPQIAETFEEARKKGVPIAFGSDAGVFEHGKNADEFLYMVQGGMKEWDALYSSWFHAALLLGVDEEVGQISEGYKADFIATMKNPLDDIKETQKVVWIMKDGVVQ